MDKTSFRLKSYWNYLFSRRSIQYIHSPFLFELMKFVFDDSSKGTNSDYKKIEQIRKMNQEDSTVLNFEDFGAGGDVLRTKQITVSNIAGRSVKQSKYARFLHRLCLHIQGKSIVELGTSLGITTSYLALVPDSTVYTVEGDAGVKQVAIRNWMSLDCKNIKPFLGDINEHLPIIYHHVKKIDVLFIDANHRMEAMVRYYLQALPYLHDKSIVVFDDIHWNEETHKAWEMVKRRNEVTLSFDIYQMGVLFFNPDLSKEDFTLSY